MINTPVTATPSFDGSVQATSTTWFDVVLDAVRALDGGRGVMLSTLYAYLKPRRPKTPRSWKSIVRRTLSENRWFVRRSKGVWGMIGRESAFVV